MTKTVKYGDIVIHIGLEWQVIHIEDNLATIIHIKTNGYKDIQTIELKRLKKDGMRAVWKSKGYEDVEF